MKIACAQLNAIVADVEGNTKKIIGMIDRARELGAECVVFPEMAVIGYPPMDLLEHDKLIRDNLRAIGGIARISRDIDVLCGYVEKDESRSPSLLNAVAHMRNGEIVSRHFKSLLPTYDVFDEYRYFSPAEKRLIATINGKKLGITICEDIWNDRDEKLTGGFIEGRSYSIDPVSDIIAQGVDLIINISASPFIRGKCAVKRERACSIARKNRIPVIYVNQVGGNDSLVFDGGSFAVNTDGRMIAMAKSFEEDILVVDTESVEEIRIPDEGIDAVEKALVLGVRDYCRKCGFKGAVLGLSGGIDSAVTAVIAAEALGKENIIGVTMPSKYSSKGSVDDSYELARSLGIRIETIPIRGLYDEFIRDLDPVFKEYERDVTEENLQARIRGTVLMAFSNKFGYILLTTGNKSELAMGYCTLYGDMNGGLAVISDLPKVMVYTLAEHINRNNEIIPRSIIDKAPSAELRENQKDQDTLPPYEILDGILEMYIERHCEKDEILQAGYDAGTVEFVLRVVDRNEYKRRQAAPGIKVTTKAFGLGRRTPMAMRFSH